MPAPTPLHRHPGFHIRLGFVPLLDSTPLIMARELGLFDAEGLEVELMKEGSWASVRDKVSFGLLDGAQMLAPMPLTMSLTRGQPATQVVSGMVLSRNGNGITLARPLYQALRDRGVDEDHPIASASALRALARERNRPVRLASVAPWSSHDLQLRDWLGSAGELSDAEVEIIPVSPVQMIDAFRAGAIEGCCVGEPWNSLLELEGLGRILHSGHQIWQNAPEKVLGVRADWAQQHPTVHLGLIRALLGACRWLDNPQNHRQLARILSRREYLGEQVEQLAQHPFGLFHPGLHQHFFERCANFPWLSQAHWLGSRLVCHGQLRQASLAAIKAVIRPDIYRQAADTFGLDAPTMDGKTEGRHHLPFTVNGRHGPVDIASDQLLGQQLHEW
ncbi:CmpA/NrtA family ABC transporter substrate-binding protein [Marinobacter xestospongiae]|uniref:CmpA/NrtA family ABC transporter substrate-binding protein n=1 Tax=Marinobacter xestospongiae TaxID=994319 RepID=A0ABU3W245_9GAMM|nr:CmpA/NrtA family ABC transporter substrate-binding protein [Marinobacter xestospongiae]MDV2080620.1 CmpA/NrtA family ABC transporter substrate-binding protein [Marinobacter xestospongiae]